MADLAEGAPTSGWFAVIAGEEMGPFSEAELRVLASRGAIASSSKVRAAEATEQITARDVPGLYAPAVSEAAAQATDPAAQATRIGVRF